MTEQQALRAERIMPLYALTVFLIVMNTTMFNVALPSIGHDMHLSSTTTSWIVTGYSIVFAIGTITYSRLTDSIPLKKLLGIGLAIFFLASLIGLFAESFWLLLTARLVQAMGGGVAAGTSMVFATRYIPVERRGRAMSLNSSAAALGFGLGPVIGGAITTGFGWNYLFLISGFVLLIVPLFLNKMPEEEQTPVSFDAVGALLLGAGVTSLLLYITTFRWPFLLLGPPLLFFTWRHWQRRENPFVQPDLLQNRDYLRLLFMGFCVYAANLGSLFLVPLLLTLLHGTNAAEIGLLLFPGSMLSAVLSLYIGRLIDRWGNRPLIWFGFLGMLTAVTLFLLFAPVTPSAVLFSYLFLAVGFSTCSSALNNQLSRTLPSDRVGAGMGMNQLCQFFGGAFGVAMGGVLLTHFSVRTAFAALLALLSAAFLAFIKKPLGT